MLSILTVKAVDSIALRWVLITFPAFFSVAHCVLLAYYESMTMYIVQWDMNLAECMTLPENLPTTIFSVKAMHLCIRNWKILGENGANKSWKMICRTNCRLTKHCRATIWLVIWQKPFCHLILRQTLSRDIAKDHDLTVIFFKLRFWAYIGQKLTPNGSKSPTLLLKFVLHPYLW